MKGMYSSTDVKGVASMVYLFNAPPGHDQPSLVTHIWTRHDIRGKGYASRLFNQVLADADRQNVVLMLSIQPDPGGLPYSALHLWYKRCGFIYCSEYDDPTMIRYPQELSRIAKLA